MHRKYLNGEGILAKLREADVLLAKGMTKKEVCKALRISSWSYDHWRRDYSGMSAEAIDRVRRLKRKNNRLSKRMVTETRGNVVLVMAFLFLLMLLLVLRLLKTAV